MAVIKLTKGMRALVSDEDYDTLSKYNWFAHSMGAKHGEYYAMRDVKHGGGIRRIGMHRAVTNAPSNLEVDHINGDRLDNRRCNLRLDTRQENSFNQGLRINNSSGFKGVSWSKVSNKWRSYVNLNGRQIHLGLFEDKACAAIAYNKRAIELFGPYARINDVQPGLAYRREELKKLGG